jgi:protein SCO1/2
MALLRTLSLSLALLLAGGATLYAATDGLQAFTTETARRMAVRRQPVDVPAAALQTQSGERIDLAGLRGKWLLVDFIYTRCASYCLALGSEFAQLQERLAAPLAQGQVELLSISFDPAHDTPQQLGAYLLRARSRGAGWLAARPLEAEALTRLERSFGVTVIEGATGEYTHNAAIHVVDPQGRLVEIVDLGQSALAARTVLQGLAK